MNHKFNVGDLIYSNDVMLGLVYEIIRILSANETYITIDVVSVWNMYGPTGYTYSNQTLDMSGWDVVDHEIVVKARANRNLAESYITKYDQLLNLINSKNRFKNIIEYIEEINEP